MDVNGYEETPGKSRGGKRYKRDEDAREGKWLWEKATGNFT